MEGITVEKNKSYYQTLFQEYPDVVTQEQLRMMLNGVSISFASKLIHEKRVKSFFIKPAYYIFKDNGACGRRQNEPREIAAHAGGNRVFL